MSELIKRLNYIQRKLKAPKGEFNSFGKFNYRKLEDILAAVKPLLGQDAAIIFKQHIETHGDREYMMSTASLFVDKDSISASSLVLHPLKIGSMSDPQLSGTAVTYAQKQAIGSLLCIDGSDSPDPDELKQEDDPMLETAAEYHALIEGGKAFEVYMFSQLLSAEERLALWSTYKSNYVAKGQIGAVRGKLKALADEGREEALRASEAISGSDESIAEETRSLYTDEQLDFISTIS